MMGHRSPANRTHFDEAPLGARVADRVASGLGSWRFIIIQTVIVLVWIALNIALVALRWDPYPFILLNLAFSTQAAYAAPVLQLASNRQTAHDRLVAEQTAQSAAETAAQVAALSAQLEAVAAMVGELAGHAAEVKSAVRARPAQQARRGKSSGNGTL